MSPKSAPWRPPTMADALAGMASRAAALGARLDAPAGLVADAAEWDPEREQLSCPRCNVTRYALELVDTSGVPETPHDHLCGGCLGDLDRDGTLPRSAAARKLGAPAGMVTANERAEARRRAEPTHGR